MQPTQHALTARLPAPLRQYWRLHGPWAVLLLSLLGLWLGHGECYIQEYLEKTSHLNPDVQRRMTVSDGYAFGYTLAYLVVRALRVPQQVLPWIGLLWSLGAITYWLAFRLPRRWKPQQGWLSGSPWLTLVSVVFFLLFDGPLLLKAWVGPNDINNNISQVVALYCVGYCLWLYFRDARQTRRQLIETAAQAELTALKAQVNPHFLFNSLNNIFGTALIEGGQRTPIGVQQLAGLLRYQLEKTQVDQVSILTELRFLDDYVQFHRQLLPHAAISHRYEWDEQPTTIAPLLLTPLVDYALQHQAERPPANQAALHSQLTVRDRFLHYQLTYPAQPVETPTDALDNLLQRLDTLYPETHTFRKTAGNSVGKLSLTILLV